MDNDRSVEIVGTSTAAARRLNRRTLLRGAGGASFALLLGHSRSSPVAAQDATDSQFANIPMPPDRGQSSLQVFDPELGHSVRGTMLDYWRANGAAPVYGHPISEPFASADGYYSQAFERAVFQYRPEYVDTNDPYIRLMSIGSVALQARHGFHTIDGRRVAGQRDLAPWSKLDAHDPDVTAIVNKGGTYVADTGHTISGQMLDWYKTHEGNFYLGNPLTEPLLEEGVTVQYFEGGMLHQVDKNTVALAPIVPSIASQLGIDTKPVEQGNLPAYSEDLFANLGVQPSQDDLDNSGQTDDPWPQIIGDLSTPGRHWVEVSLSSPETLWAYQSQTQVMTTYVSTGLDPNVTAPGLFHVRWRFSMESMQGFVGSNGEVDGFGDIPPAQGGTHWSVPNIPNVMYFNTDAEALHGCYWHNNFSNPMSHGCVNLPLKVAAWMFGWAPLGTMVWIHA